MRKLIAVFLLLCLLPFAALGEKADVYTLTPLEMTPDGEAQILDLYCGPTQGFYRHGEQALNTGEPYVLFGQYDCWAMVAQGTPESFGPVGWVEAGAITDIPYEPQLAFEDGFAATIEENAMFTDNPMAAEPYAGWTTGIAAGAQVTVLAQLGDWLYVQSEIEDTPIRAFIPMSAVY